MYLTFIKSITVFLIFLVSSTFVYGESQDGPQKSYFYSVKIALNSGGEKVGFIWDTGNIAYKLKQTKYKRIDHEFSPSGLEATIHFEKSGNSKIISKQITNVNLTYFTDYERFGHGGNFNENGEIIYSKIKNDIPLDEVSSIEVIENIAFAYSLWGDPKPYFQLRNPYFVFNDCGTGCPIKLYSDDPTVTRELLRDLSKSDLHCRNTSKVRRKVFRQYSIKRLHYPFCHLY